MSEVSSEIETRAQMALEASGAGVWMWDSSTDRITVDDRYRELYGFDAHEVVTASAWQQRLNPDDREPLMRRVLDCLREGEQWREEFRILHPLCGVRWLQGIGRVRRDEAGCVLGLIGINLDVTDRVRGGEALRQSEAKLKAVVDGVVDGIIAIDADGIIQSFNPAAVELFGYSEESVIGQNVKLLMPDPDRSAHDGYIRSYLGTGVAKMIGIGREVVGRRSDGSLFPMDLGISEVNQEGRRLFIGIVRDITERKKAEEVQRLLIDELNHRVKNTLMTVQAMAEQTLWNTHDPIRFVESFRGRLQALARAHSLLTQKTWTGVDFHALVREQLVLDVTGDQQITYLGPAVVVDPQAAVHLGLVLHELGTNARKYGALSVADGRLHLGWSLLNERAGRALVLDWVESGGPTVSPPSVQGFGTLLVERGIRHTLRGEVRHTFGPSGVTCEMRIPIS